MEYAAGRQSAYRHILLLFDDGLFGATRWKIRGKSQSSLRFKDSEVYRWE